jgi:hypothetical protein
MFWVVVGAAIAFVILIIVGASLLRAAGLEEPTPDVDEDERSSRKAAA